MLSQKFEADFNDLHAGNFTQNEQQPQTKTPEITNIERFWTLTGNWGEFGSYFSAGLFASFIVRAVPVLIPAAVIFIPAVSLGLVLYSFSAEGANKVRLQLILLSIGTALLSANWDAWLPWVIANSQLLLFTAVFLIISGSFVITEIWSRFNVSE